MDKNISKVQNTVLGKMKWRGGAGGQNLGELEAFLKLLLPCAKSTWP